MCSNWLWIDLIRDGSELESLSICMISGARAVEGTPFEINLSKSGGARHLLASSHPLLAHCSLYGIPSETIAGICALEDLLIAQLMETIA